MLCDLHAAQIQGFFNIPVDNLYCLPLMCDPLRLMGCSGNEKYVMVSPHTSGAKRTFWGAKKLSLEAVIMETKKDATTSRRVSTFLGNREQVEGKHCIVLDDLADTMGVCTDIAFRAWVCAQTWRFGRGCVHRRGVSGRDGRPVSSWCTPWWCAHETGLVLAGPWRLPTDLAHGRQQW